MSAAPEIPSGFPASEPGTVSGAGSARDRLYKTEAVVLRQIPTGEADVLLTLATPYLGKLRVVARGARKPRSKLGGHIEPLVRCRLMLARGRSLDTVSQAETLEGHTALRSDLDRTARGLYCAELLDAVLPEESPQPQAFTLFIRILSWLDEGESDLLLRWFELHLLAVAGFKPELQQCAECGGPLSPEGCSFSVDAGGVLCSACRASAGGEERRGPVISITLNALKTLRYLQDNDYAEARRLRVLASLAAEVEGALRLYIRHILERDVRSTAFLDHLRRGLST